MKDGVRDAGRPSRERHAMRHVPCSLRFIARAQPRRDDLRIALHGPWQRPGLCGSRIRNIADQFAAAGFVAAIPDIFDGRTFKDIAEYRSDEVGRQRRSSHAHGTPIHTTQT